MYGGWKGLNEVVDNAQKNIKEWIETAKELGREISVPRGKFGVSIKSGHGDVKFCLSSLHISFYILLNFSN